jgi:hypothetical protein
MYDSALDSDVTVVACDWLFRAYLVLMIAGEDLDAATAVIHKPEARDAAHREYDDLNDDQRKAIGIIVGQHWANALRRAVDTLWHACGVLEIDPGSMHVDMVALDAATRLSEPHLLEALGS